MPYHIDWKLVADTNQERHPGVAGHRLGHVGLAGARLALEQDAPARVAAQPVLEGGVAEEQVERLGDLVAQRAQALHVVQPDVDLLGPVGQVRRASLAEHG
jgi:ABC-type sugar transport system substrate-binding protein